LTSFGIRIL